MPHSHMGWSIHLEVPNTSSMDKNLTSSGYLSFEFDDMNMLTMPRNAMPNLVPTMAYINALMTGEYGKFHKCSFPGEILAQSHVGCIGWQWSIKRLCSPSLMGPLEHYRCCIALIEMWWMEPPRFFATWVICIQNDMFLSHPILRVDLSSILPHTSNQPWFFSLPWFSSTIWLVACHVVEKLLFFFVSKPCPNLSDSFV